MKRAMTGRMVGMAVAFACGLPHTVAAQFSPGKLSRGHAFLDKATQCFKCHEPRKATTPDRCLACHRDLGKRIDAGIGYHGRMDPEQRAVCSRCHAEHAGRKLSLIRWERGRERFEHATTGHPLEGAHQRLQCDDCHRASLIRDPSVRQEANLSLARTHLGLSRACRDCHGDAHHGQFEAQIRDADCRACHDQKSWKNVPFDHATAQFALRGRHAKVACERCHPRVDASNQPVDASVKGSFIRFKPLGFGSCSECHRDPHRARYGTGCTQCHDESGWKSIRTGSFEHDKTDFPLLGKHRGVRCDRCHKTGNFKQPLAHARCADCHADTHEGQLVHRSDGGRCASCHDVTGFAPVRFGLEQHAQSRFALDGAHRAIACNRCHRPLSAQAARGAVQFWFEERSCATCHRDQHAAQFVGPAGETDCARCHTTAGWTIASFAHDQTRFPLRGAHARVACAACHRTEGLGTERIVRYRPIDTTCRSCHAEPVSEAELGVIQARGREG